MKRKYREAMRAAARERDHVQDEAEETLDWFEEWAKSAKSQQQEEKNTNQRSQE